jgi:hypothetical protein
MRPSPQRAVKSGSTTIAARLPRRPILAKGGRVIECAPPSARAQSNL